MITYTLDQNGKVKSLHIPKNLIGSIEDNTPIDMPERSKYLTKIADLKEKMDKKPK